MTDITITKKVNRIVKVVCSGHTGYGVEGEDIVCAALSSVVQTALMGLLAVARVKVDYHRDDKKGTLTFALPDGLSEGKKHDAAVILDTMLCGVSDLREGFSDFINLEVTNL